jgi:hypothetical protein
MDTLRVPQGSTATFTVTIEDENGDPETAYTGDEVLAGAVWVGGNLLPLFSFTPTWNDPAAPTVDVTLAGTDTAGLTAGDYRIEITADGVTVAVAVLVIYWSPGTSVCTDLVTQDYLASALARAGFDLTSDEAEALPALAAAASAIVRRFCGDRDFNQQSYDRIFSIELDGSVSLPQIPVLKVTRVCAQRTPAVTITNTSTTTNQRATVEFTCTGDEDAGITYTGITLTRTASGVTSSSALLFATYVTLTALATAVNGLGNGWSATVAGGYELKGTAELIAEDDTAQDTFSGATLDIWGADLTSAKVNKRTGILDVGAGRVLGIDGPRWGPGWEIFANDSREEYSKVRVVYTAGFVTIPPPVQLATVLTVQSMLSTLRTDPRLSSESDGAYSYVVNTAFADYALPKSAIGHLYPYVLHHT